jgi:hypothetical protein
VYKVELRSDCRDVAKAYEGAHHDGKDRGERTKHELERKTQSYSFISPASVPTICIFTAWLAERNPVQEPSASLFLRVSAH